MYDATMDAGAKLVHIETDEGLSHLMAELTDEQRQQLQAIETEQGCR